MGIFSNAYIVYNIYIHAHTNKVLVTYISLYISTYISIVLSLKMLVFYSAFAYICPLSLLCFKYTGADLIWKYLTQWTSFHQWLQYSPDNILACRSVSFKGNVVISITFDDQRWVH